MKLLHKISIFFPVVVLMFLIDVSYQPQPQQQIPVFQLVSEAQAVLGVRRRSARRGYAAGATAAATTQAAAQPQQQAAPPPAPAPAPAAGPALGSMVSTLPAGCSKTAVKGVEYHKCGGVYYRAAFQGNNLVYVVSQP